MAHTFEEVILVGDPLPGTSPLLIGDFYGEPAASAIDSDEQWCVTVGCGLIAYRLAPPWTAYRHPPVDPSGQWWEFGNPDDPTWFVSVTPIGPAVFSVLSERDGPLIVDCHLQTVTRPAAER